MLLSIGIITLLTISWIYVYSLTGISFDLLFQLGEITELMKVQTLIFLVISGALLATTLMLTQYFSQKQRHTNSILAIAISTSIAIAALAPILKNPPVFVSMMMFYLSGLILIAYLPMPEKKKGILNILSSGWETTKKVVYFLGLGGFIITMLMTFATLEQRQEQIQDSVVEITQAQIRGMDLEGMVGEGIGPGLDAELTKEEFEEQLIEGIKTMGMPMNYSRWQELDEEQQENIINQSYQNYQEEMEEGLLTMPDEQLEEQVEETVAEMFVEIPAFRIMLDLLPILTAAIASSMIVLYGTILVPPFFILGTYLIPEHEENEEEVEEKEEEKKPEKDKEEKQK